MCGIMEQAVEALPGLLALLGLLFLTGIFAFGIVAGQEAKARVTQWPIVGGASFDPGVAAVRQVPLEGSGRRNLALFRYLRKGFGHADINAALTSHRIAGQKLLGEYGAEGDGPASCHTDLASIHHTREGLELT